MEKNMTMQEGTSWFWKLFGGTIIGTISVLLLFVLNSFNTYLATIKSDSAQQITQIRADLQMEMTKLKDEVVLLQTKVAGYEEFRLSVKDKSVSLENAIKERATYSETNVATLREKDKELDKSITELRERLLKVEERLGKMNTQPNP